MNCAISPTRQVLMSLCVFVFCVLSSSTASAQGEFIPIDHRGEPPAAQTAYMPNLGQLTALQGGLVPDILYYSIQSAPQMFFAKGAQVYVTLGARDTSETTPDTLYRIGMRLVGELADEDCVPVEKEEVSDYWNFVLGHCPNGIYEVHGSRRLIYENIYPYIDFHVYSNPWGPKFYFVIRPGGDPESIQMQFDGQDSLSVDMWGFLRAYTEDHQFILPKGLCYQQIDDETELVDATLDYLLTLNSTYARFSFEEYDPNYPLIVDVSANYGAMGGGTDMEPEWCTYYGHTEADSPTDAVLLSDGGLIVCGRTNSPSFPLFLEQDGLFVGGSEGYYSEFDYQYHRVYTTLIGGSEIDNPRAIGLTPDENSVYVVLNTNSTDLPTMQYGSSFFDDTPVIYPDGNFYIGRFSRVSVPMGTPELLTYFGQGIWTVNDMKIGTDGHVHIIGTTDSFEDPVPENTCQGTDGTFPICNPSGSADFTDGSDNGGTDAYYVHFDEDFNLVHSTFYGGPNSDHGYSLVLEPGTGRVFFCGATVSPRVGTPTCNVPTNGSFPLCNTLNGYFQSNLNVNNTAVWVDGYIACLGPDGALLWSTYVGTSEDDLMTIIGMNLNGDIYLHGIANTANYAANTCAPPTGAGIPNCASGTQIHWSRGPADYETYVLRFDGANYALAWSSWIEATVSSFRPDEGGNMVLAMSTNVGSNGTTPFPVLPRLNTYFQPLHADQAAVASDGMFMGLNNSDELAYSSYFGGYGGDGAIRVLPWSGGRLYMVGGSGSLAGFPFHCPPTVDPYCYLTYATQSATAGEAFYAQLQYDLTIGVEDPIEATLPADGLLVYPNPVTDAINIGLGEEWLAQGPVLISVYDALGQLKQEERLGPAPITRMPLLDRISGTDAVLFVRVRSSDGSLDVTRSVINQ